MSARDLRVTIGVGEESLTVDLFAPRRGSVGSALRIGGLLISVEAKIDALGSLAGLVEALGGISEVAAIIGAPESAVRLMLSIGEIPLRCWAALLDAARVRGIGLTADHLMRMHVPGFETFQAHDPAQGPPRHSGPDADQNISARPDGFETFWLRYPVRSRTTPEERAARPASSPSQGAAQDRIPSHYVPATWRNITPIDPASGHAGIGFETERGLVFLRLSVDQLQAVRDVVIEQLDQLQRTKSQDLSSHGSPRSDVLTPDEVLK